MSRDELPSAQAPAGDGMGNPDHFQQAAGGDEPGSTEPCPDAGVDPLVEGMQEAAVVPAGTVEATPCPDDGAADVVEMEEGEACLALPLIPASQAGRQELLESVGDPTGDQPAAPYLPPRPASPPAGGFIPLHALPVRSMSTEPHVVDLVCQEDAGVDSQETEADMEYSASTPVADQPPEMLLQAEDPSMEAVDSEPIPDQNRSL